MSVAAPVIEIATLPLGVIGTNCYIVTACGSKRSFIVDPGDEAEKVLAHVRAEQLEVEAVLVTHCHWDHIGAVAPVARELDVPVYMSAKEAPQLADPNQYRPAQLPPVEPWHVDHELVGGETLNIIGLDIDVLLVPGHSPDHMAFLIDGNRAASGEMYDVSPNLFIGDVVFQGSVGRTDLPFSSHDRLMQSLHDLDARLDPTTVLWPGHGGPTDWRTELLTNPFMRELSPR